MWWLVRKGNIRISLSILPSFHSTFTLLMENIGYGLHKFHISVITEGGGLVCRISVFIITNLLKFHLILFQRRWLLYRNLHLIEQFLTVTIVENRKYDDNNIKSIIHFFRALNLLEQNWEIVTRWKYDTFEQCSILQIHMYCIVYTIATTVNSNQTNNLGILNCVN